MSDRRHRRAAELLAEGHTIVATAEAVGVSERTVRRWRDGGKLPEVSAGDAGRAVRGPDTEPDIPPADWSRKEAERRKQIALARKHELDVQERQGDLVQRLRAELDREYGAILDQVRRRLQNAEGRWPPLLACGCQSPREVATRIRPLIRELLEELAGPAADAVQAGGTLLPEDFPGRAPLLEAGVETIEAVQGLEDLQGVHGIGPATEQKILKRLEALNAA